MHPAFRKWTSCGGKEVGQCIEYITCNPNMPSYSKMTNLGGKGGGKDGGKGGGRAMQNILQNLAGVQGGPRPEGGPNSVECSTCHYSVFSICVLYFMEALTLLLLTLPLANSCY